MSKPTGEGNRRLYLEQQAYIKSKEVRIERECIGNSDGCKGKFIATSKHIRLCENCKAVNRKRGYLKGKLPDKPEKGV